MDGRVMRDARSRVSIVIFDAWRDNPFTRRFRSATRGLAVMAAPSGTVVVYATSPGSVAADGTGRNGLFTGELLKAMRVPGLPIESTFKRVIANVRQRTRNQQIPWTLSSLDGDFVFALPTSPVALAPAPAPGSPSFREEIVKEFGSLVISAPIPGVEVFLADRRVGEVGPGRRLTSGELEAGVYRLRAHKAGYKDWEREVRVAANQRAEVVIDLEALGPAKVVRGDDGAEMSGWEAWTATTTRNRDTGPSWTRSTSTRTR